MFNPESGVREVPYVEQKWRCGEHHMLTTHPTKFSGVWCMVCSTCDGLIDHLDLVVIDPSQSKVNLKLQEVLVKHTT